MSGTPPWFRILIYTKLGFDINSEEDNVSQVMLVVGNLALHQLISPSLAIVRKVKQVNKVRLFFLNSLPREVDDTLEAEGLKVKVRGLKGVIAGRLPYLMVFLPTMPNQNGVSVRKGNELEF